MQLRTFYVAANGEAGDFRHNEVREVEAISMECAAEIESDRMFDEEGVDPMRAVEVIVAEDKAGTGAMLFKVRRVVEVRHEIDHSEEIDIPAADTVDIPVAETTSRILTLTSEEDRP